MTKKKAGSHLYFLLTFYHVMTTVEWTEGTKKHLQEIQVMGVMMCMIICTQILLSKGDSFESASQVSLCVRWKRGKLINEFWKKVPMYMETARLLFDKMLVRDLTGRDIVILGYTKNKSMGIAIELELVGIEQPVDRVYTGSQINSLDKEVFSISIMKATSYILQCQNDELMCPTSLLVKCQCTHQF